MSFTVYDNGGGFEVLVVVHVEPVGLWFFVIQYVQTFQWLAIGNCKGAWG